MRSPLEGDLRPRVDASVERSEHLQLVHLRTLIENRDGRIEHRAVTILEEAEREGRNIDEVVDAALQAGRTDGDSAEELMHPQTRQALDNVSIIVPTSDGKSQRELSFNETLDARDLVFRGVIGGNVLNRQAGIPIREVVETSFREARQSWDEAIPKAITDAYDQTLIPVLRDPAVTQ